MLSIVKLKIFALNSLGFLQLSNEYLHPSMANSSCSFSSHDSPTSSVRHLTARPLPHCLYYHPADAEMKLHQGCGLLTLV